MKKRVKTFLHALEKPSVFTTHGAPRRLETSRLSQLTTQTTMAAESNRNSPVKR